MVCCRDRARGVSTPRYSSTDSTTVNGSGPPTRTSQLPATSDRPLGGGGGRQRGREQEGEQKTAEKLYHC